MKNGRDVDSCWAIWLLVVRNNRSTTPVWEKRGVIRAELIAAGDGVHVERCGERSTSAVDEAPVFSPPLNRCSSVCTLLLPVPFHNCKISNISIAGGYTCTR